MPKGGYTSQGYKTSNNGFLNPNIEDRDDIMSSISHTDRQLALIIIDEEDPIEKQKRKANRMFKETQTSFEYVISETSSEQPPQVIIKAPTPPEMNDVELSIGGLSQTSYNRWLKQQELDELERQRLANLPKKIETESRALSAMSERRTWKDIGVQNEVDFDDVALSAWEMSEHVKIIEKDAPKPETRDMALSPRPQTPRTPPKTPPVVAHIET